MTAYNTRSSSSIWLVGATNETFQTSKLPSRGDILKVLFYYHTDEAMSLKESIDKSVSLLLPIWEMARIPTKARNHVVEHVRKLHAEWQCLKKNINRSSATNLSNQEKFCERLDDLFDIAHQDAMSTIKIEEDRLFLVAQREKGRRGKMGGVDIAHALKEERAIKRKIAAEKYSLKVNMTGATTVPILPMSLLTHAITSDENSSQSSESDAELEAGPSIPKTPKTQSQTARGTVDIVTPQVAAALDRTNTSDRKAAHIFSAMASTGLLKQDVEEVIISASAIRRARMKHRRLFSSEVKDTFDPAVPLILHWDGKIMDDLTDPERGKVDRLPILVSGQDVVKLLSVPKLQDGTAASMAQAITQTIDDWGLRDRIKGLCFDTTSSNTGTKNGTCIQLEEELGRQLVNLACRHHISEIILEKVFSIEDVSKSPNMELFGHFKDFWPRIDQKSFCTAAEDNTLASIIAPWKDNVIKFALAQLNKFQPRDDYCELLELSIIFLGGTPERGIRFRYPGAIHRARWMARAIYSIKMWLFRKQYEPLQPGASSRKSCGLSYGQKIRNHLQEVSLFITKVYLKYWFESPAANCAPRQDLELLCALSEYPNTEIAKAATTAFGRHLWYLSETLVALGFFDDAVTIEEKRLMVLSLKEVEGSDEPLKRIQPFQHPTTKKLHNFVTKSTINFFTILGLSQEFLHVDPSDWEFQPEYQESKRLVLSLKVINDLAERGVALIQEFNSSLTRNEEQKQYLLQVVENHRKKFSAPTKSSAVDAKLQLLANSK